MWVLFFNFFPDLTHLAVTSEASTPARLTDLGPSPQYSKRQASQDTWWVLGRIPTLTRAGSVSGQVAATGICSGGGARRARDLGIARPRPRPRTARLGLSFSVRERRYTPRGLLAGCWWAAAGGWRVRGFGTTLTVSAAAYEPTGETEARKQGCGLAVPTCAEPRLESGNCEYHPHLP